MSFWIGFALGAFCMGVLLAGIYCVINDPLIDAGDLPHAPNYFARAKAMDLVKKGDA